MGGMPPINPIDMLALSERLGWPAEDEDVIAVLCAIDDACRELHAK